MNTKLRISIITLVIVLGLTLTTSYAWISLATINKIEDINITAIQDYELEMSLDGIEYFSELPKELILPQIRYLGFADVTTEDGRTFLQGHDAMYPAKKNSDYLSLTFYFRTTTRFTEVHLSDLITDASYNEPPEEGTYIVSKGKSFRAPFRFLYGPDDFVEQGETRTYYAHEAMRVSFYDYDSGITKIFDLSGNEERGFGARFGAYEYYRLVRGHIRIPPTPPETLYTFSTFEGRNALTHDSHILTLKPEQGTPYSVGQIEMNVWLEGWDPDALDAVFGDELKLQFMFRAVIPKL